MDSCERLWVGRSCALFGDKICAFAANEVWNGDGNLGDHKSLVQLLTEAGFPYAAKVYLLHSYEQITDERVKERLHESYVMCVAKERIARAAADALRVLTEDDQIPDPNDLGKIVFNLNP